LNNAIIAQNQGDRKPSPARGIPSSGSVRALAEL
jgi:hypothetical protein